MHPSSAGACMVTAHTYTYIHITHSRTHANSHALSFHTNSHTHTYTSHAGARTHPLIHSPTHLHVTDSHLDELIWDVLDCYVGNSVPSPFHLHRCAKNPDCSTVITGASRVSQVLFIVYIVNKLTVIVTLENLISILSKLDCFEHVLAK